MNMADDLPERRGATAIGGTEGIPVGTLLTVPSAPPTGPTGSSPVVAVNNVSKWIDPTFLVSSISSALLIFADPIITAITQKEPFNWRTFTAGCVLALVAWSRTRSNSVTKS